VSTISSFGQSYNPKILFTLVDKNTTHRLFEKDNGHGYVNPGPGTIVDTGLVEHQGENKFDFFLIPHKATIATARPVHYDVVYNTTGVKKKDIELLTYHLCYTYVNFCGSIKVPAATMYAHKIANYAHENKVTPSDKLELKLHYL
jgi:aubergine